METIEKKIRKKIQKTKTKALFRVVTEGEWSSRPQKLDMCVQLLSH